MSKPPVNTEVSGKVTTSHSEVKARHIRPGESDAIAERIKEVMSDESVSSFSRRCGFGESLLRKYLAGALPNAQNLAAIADAGGVTIDWLATGRPPKTRAEQRALAAAARPAAGEADLLAAYRAAAPAGRHALDQLAAALRTPSAPAWLAAGQAINAAAALSGQPETGQP